MSFVCFANVICNRPLVNKGDFRFMETLDIKNKIKSALEEVLKNDAYLLKININERTIAHKLATYLQCEFPDYDVDCEYNRNVLQDDGQKYIFRLKEKLRVLGLLKEEEKTIDKEIIERLVYPDIIIHKRDNTTRNICIIEIKKSTSTVPYEYDESKLECYTSSDLGNNLNYQLGVFIEFKAGVETPTYTLKCYQNGTKKFYPQD